MTTLHLTPTKNSRRSMITSGVMALVLTSMAIGFAPAKASATAGPYTCESNETHTHLSRQACGA